MKGTKLPRVESVDILRGVLAIGVMLYHYTLWLELPLPAIPQAFLHAVGFYGVEAFFAISGFSLYYVNSDEALLQPKQLRNFIVKRIFRIAPLFYFALVASLTLRLLAKYVLNDHSVDLPSPWQTLGNVSLVFGVWDPASSLVVAGWSIGVEVAFYAMFPLIASVMSKGWSESVGLCLISVGAFQLCESSLLTSERSLAAQWGSYVLVPNHLVFFVAGMMMVRFRRLLHRTSRGVFWGFLTMGMIVCTGICMGISDEIALVTGWRRYALSLVTLALCHLVCNYNPRAGYLYRIGVYCGEISFSVYLLHFFSFAVLGRAIHLTPAVTFIGSVVVTIAAASLSYLYIEMPFMKYGKTWLILGPPVQITAAPANSAKAA